MINDARQALPGDDPITITLGADKGYDAREFIDALQEMNVLPPCGAEQIRASIGGA